MTKYIWATDLSQINVYDETLKNFETFDTSDEAFQDAIDHLCGMGCDVTIYVAKLELHLINIQTKELKKVPYQNIKHTQYIWQIENKNFIFKR